MITIYVYQVFSKYKINEKIKENKYIFTLLYLDIQINNLP